MIAPRVTAKLRGAYSRGAGFGVARRLLSGLSFSGITTWLTRTFGNLAERELLELVEHGRKMRAAGVELSQLGPGRQLSIDSIPVNPWASHELYEGSRVLSEIILPWQIQGTDQVGEWYHRIHHTDVISVDEIQNLFDSWIADKTDEYVPEALEQWLRMQFDLGSFIGVGIERAF